MPADAEAESEADFPAYAHVDAKRFALLPRTTREFPVVVTDPSLVVAQVVAFGNLTSIQLTINVGGVVAGTASVVFLPPDRAEAATAAAVPTPNAVTVRIANQGITAIDVRLVVEVAQQTGGM